MRQRTWTTFASIQRRDHSLAVRNIVVTMRLASGVNRVGRGNLRSSRQKRVGRFVCDHPPQPVARRLAESATIASLRETEQRVSSWH